MTSFLRSIGPMSVVALTVAFVSPAVATDLSDARDVANPERMTEPAKPEARAPAIPGDRKLTRPEAAQPGEPSSAQPEPKHPDEGYRATVERGGEPAMPVAPPAAELPRHDAIPPQAAPVLDAPNADVAGEQPAAKPDIDPAVAAEEKPGAEAERDAALVKDSRTIAEESAHERGLSNVASDVYTTARVKMSLAMDSRTPARDINVDTTDGRVTLFGIVPTDEAKFAAGADALSISGVEAVDNTLQVVAEDLQPDVDARDAQVRESLEKNLEPYPSMKDVWIDVKNCVARLRGAVAPGKEREEAMLAVRKTPGVCQVKDELKFAAS